MERAERPRHKTEDRAQHRRSLIYTPGCAGPAPGSAFNENGKAETVLKLLGLFWESAVLFEAHGNISIRPTRSRFTLRENRWKYYRILSDWTIIRCPDCAFSFQADLKERKGLVAKCEGSISKFNKYNNKKASIIALAKMTSARNLGKNQLEITNG